MFVQIGLRASFAMSRTVSGESMPSFTPVITSSSALWHLLLIRLKTLLNQLSTQVIKYENCAMYRCMYTVELYKLSFVLI